MKRLDLYFKVEVELPDGEDLRKLTEEILRLLRNVYGVRRAELMSSHER